MGVFRLMRTVTEADPVTIAFADCIAHADEHDENSSLVGPWALEFWNMKQRGELAADEPLATWAVLMRHIDASQAVRIVLEHSLESFSGLRPLDLMTTLRRYREAANGRLRSTFVAKARTTVVSHLKVLAASDDRWWKALDADDAGLLLTACETALYLDREKR